MAVAALPTTERRSPRGERGLKSMRDNESNNDRRRSPRGERGLKFRSAHKQQGDVRVAPHAGSVD